MHVGKVMGTVIRIALTLAAIAMATAPVWLGPESVTAGAIALAAIAASKWWPVRAVSGSRTDSASSPSTTY
jgi:hypothetical protein